MSHCCFFLTLVRLQRSGERHLVRFWRRWQHLVSSPSSSIQRWLSYGTKENREASIPLRKRRILSVPCPQQKSYAAALRGDDGGSSGRCFSGSTEGVTAWMDLALAAQRGMMAGWPWMLAKPIFFAFSSLILGYCPYLSGTTISLLVRLTLHFSVLEGTNGE